MCHTNDLLSYGRDFPSRNFFRAVGDKRYCKFGDKRYCKFNVVLFGDGRKFPQKMQKNDEMRRKRLTNVKIIAKIHA